MLLANEEVTMRLYQFLEEADKIREDLPKKPQFNALLLNLAFKHIQDQLDAELKNHRAHGAQHILHDYLRTLLPQADYVQRDLPNLQIQTEKGDTFSF